MHPRHLAPRILAALRDTPAVLLAGGRQTGKTTLARAVVERRRGARYLTLDDPTVRAAAAFDPAAFLGDLEGLVVLDEVQQVPELYPILRQEIDRDRRPGRFLLTGSAQVLTTPRLGEVLVGRLEVLRLWPLSQGEMLGIREGFVDAVFNSRLPGQRSAGGGRSQLIERALRGGLPEPAGRRGERRAAWFRSYLDLLLQRDVRDLAEIDRLVALPRLLELLAARAGALLNFAELSRSAGIPQTTLKRYFALLEGVFLLFRVPAWARNPSKRIVKSPKLYFCDSGLLGHLQRLSKGALRIRPQAAGPLIENLVGVELAKQVSWSRTPCRVHHFRTSAGREVDFVLEDDRGRIIGIEVKSASAVKRSDFRGLETLAEIAGPAFHRGLVLYAGSDRVAFGSNLHAIPIDALWDLGSTKVVRPLPSSDS